MTVSYTANVATTRPGCFLRLLVRWKASIYKLLWFEFLIFVILYFGLSALYRFILDGDQKIVFEKVVKYCRHDASLIPLTFVLGFYVAIVVNRWWDQFMKIPWPDRPATFVNANIQGQDERGRLLRRTILRQVVLSFVLTMSSICTPVRKRFPSNNHLVKAGLMTQSEADLFQKIPSDYNKFYIPIIWATTLVVKARRENRVRDDFALKTLLDDLNDFRGSLATLICYDWVSVPLVYTQVVTIAVYTFVFSCLLGRQFLLDDTHADIIVPVFTFLEFFFYMGWLKVAEQLVNPFGEDDDDFSINWLIDRNLQVAYLIVDEMHLDHPDLVRDPHWDSPNFDLPYTAASQVFKEKNPILGSAMSLNISSNVDFLPMTGVPEVMEEDEADENGSEGVKKRPRGSANLLNITARRMSGRSNRMSSIGEESDIGFGRKSKRSVSTSSDNMGLDDVTPSPGIKKKEIEPLLELEEIKTPREGEAVTKSKTKADDKTKAGTLGADVQVKPGESSGNLHFIDETPGITNQKFF